ncbi:hypothetical protein B0H19DRAFT_1376940 [Mycena capillaripes]|nr:hypothetical protein B0H19DRAFT_1376940 [Mycena capillaripes]
MKRTGGPVYMCTLNEPVIKDRPVCIAIAFVAYIAMTVSAAPATDIGVTLAAVISDFHKMGDCIILTMVQRGTRELEPLCKLETCWWYVSEPSALLVGLTDSFKIS